MLTNENNVFGSERENRNEVFCASVCVCVLCDWKPLENEPFKWFAVVHLLAFCTYTIFESVTRQPIHSTYRFVERNTIATEWKIVLFFSALVKASTKKRQLRLVECIFQQQFDFQLIDWMWKYERECKICSSWSNIYQIDSVKHSKTEYLYHVLYISYRLYFVTLKSVSILDEKFIDYALFRCYILHGLTDFSYERFIRQPSWLKKMSFEPSKRR